MDRLLHLPSAVTRSHVESEQEGRMKLDRNINSNKRGKYALLKLRRLSQIEAWDGGEGEVADRQAVIDAIALLERAGVLDWGYAGTEGEFMLIRLKDTYAQPALRAYAIAAYNDDREYATEIKEMAERSGPASPWCKTPD
jgi:hypothetical protein